MTFDSQLSDSLLRLDSLDPGDLKGPASLEAVLERYLLEVESGVDNALLSSVLLLSEDGRRLMHGAAPSLPSAYSSAIDGIEIGPGVGSCGTAAHVGHSIFVTDIATDPHWADFRDLALAHGLRACWSTPIRDRRGQLLGTFAVYHRAPRAPTPEEIAAIRGISVHVADAVARWR